MNAREHALTTTHQRNLAIVTRDGADHVIHLAPHWLVSALNVEADFPILLHESEVPGHPLRWLIEIADEVERGRIPVADYFREIQTATGQELAVFIHAGHREDVAAGLALEGSHPGVLLAIKDVTALLRERRKAAAIGAFHGLVGQSIPMLEVFHRIAIYGPTDAPVIITGETGTGKELVARALHERSERSAKAFVAVNCAALSSDLFESELFGHEKGSFTGAFRQHRGRFERADEGTLFLDEIGEMPQMTQAKLLRALEEGVIERVGGEREQRVDVRLIAATNIPLEVAVQMRRFRADLYHRLSVLRIHLPPLRERRGDISLLAERWLDTFNRRYHKHVKRLTPEAIKILEDYHWPGNVRELRNVIERLVVETQGEAIGANALMHWVEEREYLIPGEWNADSFYAPRSPIIAEPGQWPAAPNPVAAPSSRTMSPGFGSHEDFVEVLPLRIDPPSGASEPVELTRENVLEAYRKAGGNLTQAARELGVHKATLYRHMKRLDLSRESLEALAKGA